jgi:hypothetical protein
VRSPLYASHALDAFTQFESGKAKPSDKQRAARDDDEIRIE